MFGLYAAGIASALAVSFVIKRAVLARRPVEPFMMELPDYKLPDSKTWRSACCMRAKIFLKRAGTIILSMMVADLVAAPPSRGRRRAPPSRRSTTASPP